MTKALELTSLPLFPLKTVLYPGGALHLQIFEVRYLDLISKCLKTGAPFGVVSLLEGAEVQTLDPDAEGADFANERFADVGTMATIEDCTSPQDGLKLVRCKGTQRFRMVSKRRLTHGLWVADVQCIADDAQTPIPQDLEYVAHALASVIHHLQNREQPVSVSPMHPPYYLEDCAWVANRWCELLPLAHAEKQSLMQLENPLLRLELVGDFLTTNGIEP